jgi:hypothetical protein
MMIGATHKWIVISVTLGLMFVSACKPRQKEASATESDALSSAAAQRAAARPTPSPTPRASGLPMGLRLAILAGQGLGPIRFGATVATIERLMQAKCEEVTDKVCRYITRGVEFELKSGVLARVRIHRPGRRVTAPGKHDSTTFGALNAVIPPDIAVGMLPDAVQQKLGKPKKVEKVNAEGAHRTTERHTYDGLVLEYDESPTRKNQLILGGIVIVKR